MIGFTFINPRPPSLDLDLFALFSFSAFLFGDDFLLDDFEPFVLLYLLFVDSEIGGL